VLTWIIIVTVENFKALDLALSRAEN